MYRDSVILTPEDIGSFLYCPWADKRKLYPPLTFVEDHIRKSIVHCEGRALQADSYATAKKITRYWGNLWWPAATKAGYSIEETNKIVKLSVRKFHNYCRHETNDFQTLGCRLTMDRWIGQYLLRCDYDVIKSNLRGEKPNTVIVIFENRTMSVKEMTHDPRLLALAWGIYAGNKEDVVIVSMNISESAPRTQISSCTYPASTMPDIEKMLRHTESLIKNSVNAYSSLHCKGCKVCQTSSSLTNDATP